jgi:NAD(P)-dependent dehydrogenase (short-subunit alcohol dehydrogenase family)
VEFTEMTNSLHGRCVAVTGAFGVLGIAVAHAAREAGAAVAATGEIDALVNVAAAFRWETVAEGSLETWDLLYTVNLRTAARANR